MKIFFDISTSAQWSGHAVGIVRVERELAKRARDFVPGIGYCVYDRSANRFIELEWDVAEKVLQGRAAVCFDTATKSPKAKATLRYALRQRLISKPRLYQQFQKLRGRSFSLEQIRAIASEERRLRDRGNMTHVETLDLSRLVEGAINVDDETVIISGGLDWEHKDICGIYDIKKKTGMKYVAILYDIIPIVLPHFVVPSYVDLLRQYFGELFWVADYIIAISAQTESDMRGYCESLGMLPPKSDHFPLGSDLPARSEAGKEGGAKVLDGKRYAIFVSTIEPRKNHRVLYEAWEYCLRHGMVNPDLDRLVFIGRVGWNTNDLIHEMSNNPLTRDTIVTLSNVSDAELYRLYEGALFGLFPSHYEGYGLPLAEMLSLNKACISSRSGALEEVGGDFVTYLDPVDRIGWAQAMARFFNHPEVIQEVERNIRNNYVRTTWDVSANNFFAKFAAMVEIA